MQSVSLRSLLASGLLVSVAGCFPYGYQNSPGPYGQYPPPQYLGTPAYTVPPGQPYAPGGSIPPTSGGPTLLPPNTNPQPTYDNNGNKINWDNNAPPFNPAAPNGTSGGTSGGNSGGTSGNRGTVPDPGTLEDPASSGPAASNTKLTPTSGAQRVDSNPFERESNSNNGEPAEPARLDTEPDPFEPPQRVSSTEGMPAVIQRVNHETSGGELKPDGRDLDHANPQWLRGKVDYDEQERTWQIIYAANPDPRDQNGGSLTLGNHPALARCRTGDIVFVKGAVDNSQTDLRGKPIYALDAVTVVRNPQ